MELFKRVIGILPSSSILFSTALCVVIPMFFYWISDRMRNNDPIWKQEQDGREYTGGFMHP